MILDNKSLLLENVVELEIFTDYLRHLLKILNIFNKCSKF